ncbi:TetR/AcrR family transcriptional regulator [Aminobacter aminovorans]|uniref:AcrR family transcriptional regulator n=1 Tax=Aminobacter aminovorans TaxID=83263 RepID=A0AAC9FEV2_AMIAI|nr:TetR/AcrR family transcriptional regulator [Aminobacter aminovorans]AMS45480.1 TetR family transcriptional regulator [Aminobacter aminovorans]MBB3708687.1 AcrR family transcriptional regulator [Aminobacter aminovorans]
MKKKTSAVIQAMASVNSFAEAGRNGKLPRSAPKGAKSGERKIGRRKFADLGEFDNKEVILNSAEKHFAERGYLGTSMREIAEDAEITQALITYYFGTKLNLYYEVYRRRVNEISRRRAELLSEIYQDRKVPTLEDLVRAYLQPQFEFRTESEGRMNFAKLQARLASEPQEILEPLRKEVYDKTLKLFVQEMIDVEGKSHLAAVSWGTIFMISMLLYMLRGIDRIGEITDGRFHVGNDEEILQRMVTFIVGGISALKQSIESGSRPLL